MLATCGLIQHFEGGGEDALGTGWSTGLGWGWSMGDGMGMGQGWDRDVVVPDLTKLCRIGKKIPTSQHQKQECCKVLVLGFVLPDHTGSAREPGVTTGDMGSRTPSNAPSRQDLPMAFGTSPSQPLQHLSHSSGSQHITPGVSLPLSAATGPLPTAHTHTTTSWEASGCGTQMDAPWVPQIMSTPCCSPALIPSSFPSQSSVAACSPHKTGGGKQGEEPGLAASPADNVPVHHGAATAPQRTRQETKPSGSCCCCCFRRPKATRREINDSESS